MSNVFGQRLTHDGARRRYRNVRVALHEDGANLLRAEARVGLADGDDELLDRLVDLRRTRAGPVASRRRSHSRMNLVRSFTTSVLLQDCEVSGISPVIQEPPEKWDLRILRRGILLPNSRCSSRSIFRRLVRSTATAAHGRGRGGDRRSASPVTRSRTSLGRRSIGISRCMSRCA